MRLREAGILLQAKEWAGAYYLAGYSVECGLKACICKNVKAHSFPDPDLAKKFFTHKLEELVILADLNLVLKEEMKLSAGFGSNWGVVKDWKETSRYRSDTTELEAMSISAAITDQNVGIETWLYKHW